MFLRCTSILLTILTNQFTYNILKGNLILYNHVLLTLLTNSRDVTICMCLYMFNSLQMALKF